MIGDKMKKKTIIISSIVAIIVIVSISIYFYLKHINSTEYKLTKLGYTKDETKEIIKLTSKTQVNEILNKEYDKNIIVLLKEKYFIWKNLDNYLAYYKENETKSSSDIISIINVKANNEWYTNYVSADISKKELMLVNKFHQLSNDFEPENNVNIKNWYAYDNNSCEDFVYQAFINMHNDAKKENITLIINSSYRSYQEQEETYDTNLKAHGKDYADKFAAHPGFSEHQTGLALDIMSTGTDRYNFEESDAFKWLQENAHKYGFILRYPKDKEYLTGYDYESWHYRYVGVETATKVKEKNITYDEYYAYYLDN